MANLYSDRVFSEHPIALWSMDDDISYISLISNENRSLASWSLVNSSISTYPQDLPSPIQNSPSTYLVLDTSPDTPSAINVATLTSPDSLSFSAMNQESNNFTVGAYVNITDPTYAYSQQTSSIISYEIGYRYFDEALSQFIENTKVLNVSRPYSWIFLSSTFSIPKPSGSFSLVIKVRYGAFNQPLFAAVSGIAVGQNSEEFIASKLGAERQPIPVAMVNLDQEVFGESPEAVFADQFGLGGQKGLYLIKDNSIMASMSGMPMVFGERNSVSIGTGPTSPAILFPSYGMLSNDGRYATYTCEFWIKPKKISSGYSKIFGPISLSSGIYLDGQSLVLIVGESQASYFLPNPNAPMLLTWIVTENRSSLSINGAVVLSVDFSSSDLSLYSSQQDSWLAFYQNPGVSFDIDCVSIYSYAVPSIVSKRRFAYGQAVDSPENANSYYPATSVVFDGASNRYSNNYSYPKIGRWEQGVTENLLVSSSSISSPVYSLPEISFKQGVSDSLKDWYSDIYDDSGSGGLTKYFDFQDKVDFLYFKTLNILQEETKAFYVVFKINDYSNNEEVLLWLENQNLNQYFYVVQYSDKIIYRFFDGVSEQTIHTEYFVDARTLFLGIDFDNISNTFSQSVRSFFANKSQISVYVGGYPNLSENKQTFTGGIYRIGISDQYNLEKISGVFPSISIQSYQELTLDAGGEYFGNDPLTWLDIADGGVVSSFSNSVVENMLSHVATYTLFPKFFPNRMQLDIATDSYWEDKIPLSYFGKFVKDSFGTDRYGLDFLQLSISNSIAYLQDNSYDVDVSFMNTYVTFQDVNSDISNSYDYYQNTLTLNDDRLVSPGDEWITTKYQVVDGSIIYPPSGISFEDLFVVVHLEMISGGIYTSPMSVSNLRLSSQSLSSQGSNPITTKFGKQAYPFTRYGDSYNYASKNPLRISPDPEPYLYTNDGSGLRLVSDESISEIRGISIPVNESSGDSYQVGSIQMFLSFAQDEFPNSPTQIFEIEASNRHWKFFVERTSYSTSRARMYAVDSSTGLVNRNLGFYINGNLVADPVIAANDWNIIGVDFSEILNFYGTAGALRVVGPVSVNYVSYYEYVSADNALDTFSDVPYMRSGAIIIPPNPKTTLTAKATFEMYTGTSRISNEAASLPLRINEVSYSVFNDVLWSSYTVKPV